MDVAGNDIGVTAQNNFYGFTGRYKDVETDLWYFRARYFSDELGRFVSRDPLGYVDGMSLYAGYFAAGFGLDPSGQACLNISKGGKFAEDKSTPTGWYSLYAKLEAKWKITGESCRKCCPQGTQKAGEYVYDYKVEAKVSIDGEAGVQVGINKEFDAFGMTFKGFVGGRIGGYGSGAASASGQSDRCNGDDGTFTICMNMEIGAKGTLSAMFTAKSTWWDYNIGADYTLKAKLLEAKLCFDCNSNGCTLSENKSKLALKKQSEKLRLCFGPCLTFNL